MKYTVDMNGRPVYLQIYRLLRADIVGGAFAYGSRLPSKRLLAEELGVSTVTTEHAYDLLCEEGYAQARERSGYFVIFKRSDGFAASGGKSSEPAQEKHLGHSKPVFSRITAQQDYAKGYRGQGGRDIRTLAAQGAHGAARCTAAIFSEKPRNKR